MEKVELNALNSQEQIFENQINKTSERLAEASMANNEPLIKNLENNSNNKNDSYSVPNRIRKEEQIY